MTTYEVISADSHVIEPSDLWLSYSAPDFRARAPRVVRRGGTDVYEADGVRLFTVPIVANAGRAVQWTGTFEESIPRGGYEAPARVADMARDGVDAEVVYPTFGLRLFGVQDAAYRAASFGAYNRWLADFVAGAPARLKGIGMVEIEEPRRAAADLGTLRELGLVGAMV